MLAGACRLAFQGRRLALGTGARGPCAMPSPSRSEDVRPAACKRRKSGLSLHPGSRGGLGGRAMRTRAGLARVAAGIALMLVIGANAEVATAAPLPTILVRP